MRGCYALYLNSSRLDLLPAPEHPKLPAGEVHVWRLELDPRRPRASRRELREVLARYLDEQAEAIELVEGERGKPRLAQEPPALHFNLSHSGALALVALSSDREVGVDVELVKPGRDFAALAERALAPEDAAAVREATESDRADVFYELWTRHEARLKCLGLGLGAPPPPDAPAVTVETLAVDPGYAAAVAASGPAPLQLRCWTFGPPLPEAG
jgi:4'-phosphopantetheinyl transferase